MRQGLIEVKNFISHKYKQTIFVISNKKKLKLDKLIKYLYALSEIFHFFVDWILLSVPDWLEDENLTKGFGWDIQL